MTGRSNPQRGSRNSGDDDSRPLRSSVTRKKGGNKWLTIGVTAVGMAVVAATAWTVFGPGKRAGDHEENGKSEEIEKGKKRATKSL